MLSVWYLLNLETSSNSTCEHFITSPATKLSCIIIAYRPIVWLTSKTTVTIVSGMSVTCHSHQLVVGNNIIESNFAHRVRPAFHFYSYSDACCSNYYRQSNGNYKFAQLVMHRKKLSVEIWSKGKPCIRPLTAIKRLPHCWEGNDSTNQKTTREAQHIGWGRSI